VWTPLANEHVEDQIKMGELFENGSEGYRVL
jgi:hypothetical protein